MSPYYGPPYGTVPDRKEPIIARQYRAALFGAVVAAARAPTPSPGPGGAPAPELVGEFEDDHGNRYEITAERWVHRPDIVHHVVAWDNGVPFSRMRRVDAAEYERQVSGGAE